MVSNLAAGAWRRLLAFGLDFLLIALYMTALTLVSVATWKAWIGRMPGPADAGPLAFDALSFVTLVLPMILYFAISESSSRRATWGKRRTGIVVTSLKSTRLGCGRSLLRAGLKFLPGRSRIHRFSTFRGGPRRSQRFLLLPRWD